MKEKEIYEEIIDKLEKLYKKEYAFFAAIGIQASLLITIMAITSLTVLESIFHFSSVLRTAFFLLFAILFISGLFFS
jgi:hypothetical protein